MSRAGTAADAAEPGELDPGLAGGIAVVGMSGRFPGAASVAELWRNLRAGACGIRLLSDEELAAAGVSEAEWSEPGYVRAAGALGGADLFDAELFGLSPREAEVMDPQLRVFLECAWEALEDAGHDAERFAGWIGVYAGAAIGKYLWMNVARHPEALAAVGAFQAMISNDKDYLSTQVSYRLNLRGPSLGVQTACSTSLVAVHLACQGLISGECDMALAGGVAVSVPELRGYRFQPGSITSPDGTCRPFDARAAGTIRSNGAGIVVLRRLSDALAAGDRVLAVIRGSAINNDGAAKVGFTAPSVTGQAAVIAAAQAVAGVSPQSIGYVEAHGTGTALGDPIEVAALSQAFGGAADGRRGYCALGSVKSNLGHLDAAAGVTGLIKTVLSLWHGELPPSLHYEEPNPRIDFASSPFYVNARLRPWPAGETPRRAGVSAFGIGGTNAHVVLEEAPRPAAPGGAAGDPRARGGGAAPAAGATPSRDANGAALTPVPAALTPVVRVLPVAGAGAAPVAAWRSAGHWQLLVLSAQDEAALRRLAARLAQHLEGPDGRGADLAAVAHTLQVGRRALGWRWSAPVRSREEAQARLIEAASGGEPPAALERPAPVAPRAMGTPVPAVRPAVAFVFPGQGAQFAGMGADLYGDEPVFRAAVEECCGLLGPALGGEVRRWIAGAGDADGEGDGGGAALDQTWLTQSALFVCEHSLARLWMSWGVAPAALLGHSVGELVAAALAGVLPLAEALRLVALRGRLMHELPAGAMAAVALGEEALRARLPGELDVAVVNGPRQCVVAGPRPVVAGFAAELAAEGVAVRRLRTSHAFHSRMMEPVLAELRREVAAVVLGEPRIACVSSLHGRWVRRGEMTDPDYWAQQARQPVRFGAALACLLEEPGRILLEVGPRQGLGQLARQLAEEPALPRTPPVPVLSGLRAAVEGQPAPDGQEQVLRALGQLWERGVAVDWPAVHAGGGPPGRVALPTYPFARRRYYLTAGGEPGDGDPVGREAGNGDASGAGAEGVDAGLSGGVSMAGRQPLRDWFYLPSWERSLPPASRPAAAPGAGGESGERRCLVFVDRCGLGEALAAGLRTGGWQVTTVAEGGEYAAAGADRYRLPPGDAAAHLRLWEALAAAGSLPRRILHLWNVTAAAGADSNDAFASGLDRSFYSLLHLAHGLGRHAAALAGGVEIFVFANHLHAAESGDRPEPLKATLLGPCRVMPQELEGVRCRVIEIGAGWESGAAAGEPLARCLAELEAPAGEAMVAWRGPHRWVPTWKGVPLPPAEGDGEKPAHRAVETKAAAYEAADPAAVDPVADRAAANPVTDPAAVDPVAAQAAANPVTDPAASEPAVEAEPAAAAAAGAADGSGLRRRGVYLITGGLGGLGLEIAHYLAAHLRARLVLLGRTAFPAPDAWGAWLAAHPAADDATSRTIRRLQGFAALGAEVLVVAGDVTDGARMAEVRRLAVARFGAVHGIFHAAGVPGGGLLETRSPAHAAAVLAPKVQGTRVLARVFGGAAGGAELLVLCSSLAALYGGIGQADYAAANAYLDAFAAAAAGGASGAPGSAGAGAGAAASPARVVAIDWDAWQQVGMAAAAEIPQELRAWHSRQLLEAITPGEGREALARVLASAAGQVAVSTVALGPRLAAAARRRLAAALRQDAAVASAATAGRPRHPRPPSATAYAPAATPCERQVVEVWQELLGVEPVGRDDDFFDLGGHSLLAIQLAAALRGRLGVEVPLQAIVAHTTPARLAAALDRRPAAAAARLVALQAAGAGAPFFCVHPAGGNTFSYQELAACLGTARPFHAIQSDGLDDELIAGLSIAAMAARYVAAVRAVQAAGPYHLGGWSMGGLVAYEMAQQLAAAGERVALLVLFDTRAFTRPDDVDELPEDEVEILFALYGAELGLSLPALRALPAAAVLPHVIERGQRRGLLAAEFGVAEGRRLLAVYKRNRRLMWDYLPRPYPGAMVLLQASERRRGEAAPLGLGWDGLVRGSLRTWPVPGNHNNLMAAPHVVAVAAALDRLFAEIEPGG